MRNRIITAVAAFAFVLGALGASGGHSVSAAPIDCPAGQTATKTGDFWDCVNGGGNESHAGDSSNPNGHPLFYR